MKDMEKKILAGDQFAVKLTNEYQLEYMKILTSLSKDLDRISDLLSETRDEETRILNSKVLLPEEKTKELEKQQATRNYILRGMNKRRVRLEEGLFEDIRAEQ